MKVLRTNLFGEIVEVEVPNLKTRRTIMWIWIVSTILYFTALGIVTPFIFHAMFKKSDDTVNNEFLNHHLMQVINVQVSIYLFWLLTVFTVILSEKIFLLALLLVLIYMIVTPIMGAVKGRKGNRFYPKFTLPIKSHHE